jgi:hypothetical protein
MVLRSPFWSVRPVRSSVTIGAFFGPLEIVVVFGQIGQIHCFLGQSSTVEPNPESGSISPLPPQSETRNTG